MTDTSPQAKSEQPLLIDCHSDVMVDVFRRRTAGERNVLGRRHLPELRVGGVGASVCAVGGDPSVLCPLGIERAFESAHAMLDALEADVAESDGKVAIARSADEIRTLAAAGVFAVVPSFEGAAPLRDDPGLLEQFFERGVQAIGLTWNTRNAFAVGLGVAGPGGLSDVGKRGVREMNRLGIVVDVAHLEPTSFWDVASCAQAPFIASHANARTLRDHPRNLDDDQLRAIAAARGIVGVVLYPAFLADPPVTRDHVLDQIEYLVELIEEDCVAIGADFIDYALKETAAEFALHGTPVSDQDFVYPQGLETCRSLNTILSGLAERGVSSSAIGKIAGGNLLRVLSEVRAAA